MLKRIMTAAAFSVALAYAAAPAALACGDDKHEAGKTVPADAKTVTLKVVGMSCGDCANSVRNALLKLDGVFDATVSYESGVATIKVDKLFDEAKLNEAIVKAGYKVEQPSKS